ncbi:MAG: hypothetical protein PHG99_02055 [Erysipelotrichaceae bacterium]|nr:hypothetical protein [Erysipelotrichaceae bacterium]MDD4642272.1 hypothetical protein [Erysipelotrichaceae bacterium]
MKTIVLYESKSGNTLQYAKWIAEGLGWEIRTFSSFKRFEIKFSEYNFWQWRLHGKNE